MRERDALKKEHRSATIALQYAKQQVRNANDALADAHSIEIAANRRLKNAKTAIANKESR